MEGDENLPPPEYFDPTGETAIWLILQNRKPIPGQYEISGPFGLRIFADDQVMDALMTLVEFRPTRRRNGLRAHLKKKAPELALGGKVRNPTAK